MEGWFYVILTILCQVVSSSELQVDIRSNVTLTDNLLCGNTSVLLTCHTSNATNLEYKWSPTGETIRTIVVTTTNMSTYYTCTVMDDDYNMGYAKIGILSNSSSPVLSPVNFDKDENAFTGTSCNFTVAALKSSPFFNGGWLRFEVPLNDSGRVSISNFTSDGQTYSSMAIHNLSFNDSGVYVYCTFNKCGKSCVSVNLHVQPDRLTSTEAGGNLGSSDSSIDPTSIIMLIVLFLFVLLMMLIMNCCIPRITQWCREGGLFGQRHHHGYDPIGPSSLRPIEQSHFPNYNATGTHDPPRGYYHGSNISRTTVSPRPSEGPQQKINATRTTNPPSSADAQSSNGTTLTVGIPRPKLPDEQLPFWDNNTTMTIGPPRPNFSGGASHIDSSVRHSGAPRLGERAMQRPRVQITEFRLVYDTLRQGAISSWKQLGKQLGISSDKLNEISADCGNNDYERHIERVFEMWRHQSQKQTWRDLLMAIEVTTVNPQLCVDLSKKHQAELDDKVLDKDLANEVLIPMAKYWFEIGLALGVDEMQLDNIPVSDSSQCFRKMLRVWWQQNYAADRTWNVIVFSLDAVNLCGFAKEVYDLWIRAE